MDERRREEGATLLLVLCIIVLSSSLLVGVLQFSLHASQSVMYRINATQALYDARMGVDLTLYEMDEEESRGGNVADFLSAVTSKMHAVTGGPFSVVIQREAFMKGSLPSSLLDQFSIQSSATVGGVPIQLLYRTRPVPDCLFSNSCRPPNGIGEKVDERIADISLPTVSRSANPTIILGNHKGSYYPTLGPVVMKGDDDKRLFPVIGLALVTGNHNTFYSALLCDAIITGNHNTVHTLVQSNFPLAIRGVLLITGNHNQIIGNVDGNGVSGQFAVVITGDHDRIDGSIMGNVLVTGKDDRIDGRVYGNMEVLGRNQLREMPTVTGTITTFTGDRVTLSEACLGKVSVVFTKTQPFQFQLEESAIA